MKEVVIAGAKRTAIGEFGGSLRDVSAVSLCVTVLNSVIEHAGVEKKMVDQVIMGNCFEPMDHNVARIAAVKAGFPVETPAFHIVATCGSGMQAVICGVQAIRDDDVDIVIAGGTESMSYAPYMLTKARWGACLQHGTMIDPI